MKTSLYIFILSLFLAVPVTAQEKETPPEGGTPKGFSLPEKEVMTFDNGLKLVLIPYGSIPKATLNITVKTGNIHETEDQTWLADLTGELMKEGSVAGYSVNDTLAGMGGNLNINTGVHTSSISTRVLSEFASDAMYALTDVLTNPKWPASEVDRLKSNMKRNVTVSLSTPSSQARQDFFSELYPDHSYGRIYPTNEQIDSYTLEDIKDFYAANYGAQRTTVYVVGKFNKQKIKQIVEEQMGDWQKGPEASYPVATPNSANTVRVIDRPGAPQSTLYYGLPVADPSNEDYVALDVMNSLLGGSFGSRITSNIREDKGYTYSPRSILNNNYRTGVWYEVADVTTEHTGASIDEIKKEITRLQNEPPTKEELKGIQNYESGIYVLQNSSPGGIIGQLNFLDVHELPESFLVDKVKNINAITPEDVQKMATKYITPENMTLIVVGDKEKIKNQVQETIKEPKKEGQ